MQIIHGQPCPIPSFGELIDLLQLERLEENLFRGQSRDIGTRYVFGGQVLGQALSAAQQTVDADRTVHSLHAYFLRAGDIEAPIVYNVDRTRDGKSFSVRRVVAIQHGQPIFNCSVSFQIAEAGVEHQLSMPEVPEPEDLEPPAQLPAEELAKLPPKLQRWLGRSGPFEFRHVYPRNELQPAKRPPFQQVWFRLIDSAPDEPDPASRAARLRVGFSPDRHRHAAARHLVPAAQRAGRQPRSRVVVSSSVPRRRMAAVFLRQPERAGCARPGSRHDLHPRRHPGCVDRAGRHDSRAAGVTAMRQIYTSPRVENVDRLVALLDEAGIATSVTNRRAYAGSDYKRPSYTASVDRDNWPQVWVVNAEDQPRARALLREAGIEPPTRFAEDLNNARKVDKSGGRHALVWRLRIVLLAIVAILIALNAFGVLKLF